ncbi:MAG: tripartite tricarboxylate transporter substrate binding protein [Betaproteobacteria bacterium]|jgi:tripartite-type tricarboxylate transporter receptor subunit TctC|nr:tripartite tricarboxylate transporter substrate binding protein [Burkholderiales bacterium]NBX89664.1 tripartite tricarboxylate transporter substrate binding protein [Betaproteobacteria bacterium]
MRRQFIRTAAGLALGAVSGVSIAQPKFPDRPIKLIVPLAPGGGGDIVARFVAAKLQPILGQPVVVENRAGGATVIGTDFVAKAQPNGYTLVMATSSHVINGGLIKLPFDAVKDFSGVCLVATTPLVLTVNPKKFPVRTLEELIAIGKSHPQGLTYASSGLGSLPHLSGELLSRKAGITMVHIPYKGSGPAESDLLAGQVDMYFGSPSSLGPHVKSGSLRMLASTGFKRSSTFPDIPTVGETYSGIGAETFYAILAPANTPVEILDRLNAAILQALSAADAKERLESLGAEIVASSPAETIKYIDFQVRQWEKVIKDAGIKAN